MLHHAAEKKIVVLDIAGLDHASMETADVQEGPPPSLLANPAGGGSKPSLRVSSVPTLRSIDRATAASAAASCAARRAEETLPPLFRSHVRGMSEALATPAPASAARSQRS